jgi:hypothetical protein
MSFVNNPFDMIVAVVAIDDLTAAIGRVTEGQQYLTHVLTDRGAVPVLPPRE